MQENLQRRPLTTAESLAELRVQHAKLLSAQEQTHARQQLAHEVQQLAHDVLEARGEVVQRQLAAMAASVQANIDLTPGVTDRLRTAQRRLAQHAESAIPMADLSSASLVQSAPAGAAAQPVSMAAAAGSAGPVAAPATATAVAPAPIVQQAAQAFAAADAAVAAAAGVAAARSAVPIAAAAAAAAAVAACQSAILPGTVPGMQPSAMYAMPTLAATRFTRIQRHGLGALSRGRGVAAAAVALPTAVSRRVHAAAAPAAAATPDSEPSSRRAVKELVNKVFARKGMDISLVCLISLQLCSILSHTCWSVATSFDCAVCEVKGIRC